MNARGQKCVGCIEKEDFVKRVKETADVAELPVAPLPAYYELGQVKEVTSHVQYTGGLEKHRDETGLPVVVDYFSHSCGPCIQIAPIFADLAQEYAGRAVFWKIDVNRNHESSSRAGVRSMPTFQFFLNNQKFHEFSGGDPNGLRQTVQQMVQKVESQGGPYLNMEVTSEVAHDTHAPTHAQLLWAVGGVLMGGWPVRCRLSRSFTMLTRTRLDPEFRIHGSVV